MRYMFGFCWLLLGSDVCMRYMFGFSLASFWVGFMHAIDFWILFGFLGRIDAWGVCLMSFHSSSSHPYNSPIQLVNELQRPPPKDEESTQVASMAEVKEEEKDVDEPPVLSTRICCQCNQPMVDQGGTHYRCRACGNLAMRISRLMAGADGTLKTSWDDMDPAAKVQFFKNHQNDIGKDLRAAMERVISVKTQEAEIEKHKGVGIFMDIDDLTEKYNKKNQLCWQIF